jgi:lipid-A-disaccharide synthase
MKTVYLIAGETSGDVLGGRLMKAMKQLSGEEFRFIGIGGPNMTEQGLDSLFPMSELSLMGIAEILPHLPRLIRRINETKTDILKHQPDIVITIDAPDFCFRVLKKLGKTDFPLVHYVAPTVWAWKPGRAKKIARFLDHLLTLLPFEPPYFEREGLPATYVGHSAVEEGVTAADGEAWRKEQGISPEDKVLCLLPGSRRGELARFGITFVETVNRLVGSGQVDRVIVPAAPSVAEEVERLCRNIDAPVVISRDASRRYSLFAAADAALASSGTVSLELAFTGTPMVIGYRVAPLTAMIVRWLVITDTAVLPNIVVGEKFVPEFLQDDCTAENLFNAVHAILSDDRARQAQIDGFRRFGDIMQLEGRAPSERAAEVVLDLMGLSHNPLSTDQANKEA